MATKLYISTALLIFGVSVGLNALNKHQNRLPQVIGWEDASKATKACLEPSHTEGHVIKPSYTLASEAGTGSDRGVTAKIYGKCDEGPITYIEYTGPIFVPQLTEPPPAEVALNSDDYEHVRVYFTNDEKRILEIRFNRFGQISGKLLSKPHNVLREDIPVNMTTPMPGENEWDTSIYFSSEILPAKVNKVNVVAVNPGQRETFNRYISFYRLYNSPLSLLDLYVVSSYNIIKPDTIVHPEMNNKYSDWWPNDYNPEEPTTPAP